MIDIGRAVDRVRRGLPCRYCSTKRPNHCEHKSTTETGVSSNGTFADYFKTCQRFVHKLPDGMPFHHGILVEPVSCALTGLESLGEITQGSAIVVGAGPIGLIYGSLLKTKNVAGILVERAPTRRAMGGLILGSDWLTCSTLEEARSLVADLRMHVGLVVDTTSSAAEFGVDVLDRGGKLLLVGLRSGTCTILPQAITDRSLGIFGSIDSVGTFEAGIDVVASEAIPADALITHRLPIEQYRDAFRLLGVDLDATREIGNTSGMKVALQC